MTNYNIDGLEVGDFVKIALCDDWFKITGFDSGYVDLIDDCGLTTDCLLEDIADVAPKSELKTDKYGFLKR